MVRLCTTDTDSEPGANNGLRGKNDDTQSYSPPEACWQRSEDPSTSKMVLFSLSGRLGDSNSFGFCFVLIEIGSLVTAQA